jgi:hypothetical protein
MEALDETNEMASRGSKVLPLAVGKLPSNTKPYYYKVFLWKNRADYEAGAKPGKLGVTTAMCVTDVYTNDAGEWEIHPKLGELHFQSGDWDVNTVAHEVLHATLHRMRYVAPYVPAVMNDLAPDHDPENEETIAYEHGAWVECCMRWLTNNDPKSLYPKKLFDG